MSAFPLLDPPTIGYQQRMQIPPAMPLKKDPFAYYRAYLEQARDSEGFEPTRAVLATANAAGIPNARFVLVKSADRGLFTFFTDYRSPKAHDLDANPHAALAWHWSTLGVQIRAQGPVQRASAEVSDLYFQTRPRGSQIGAWASTQSEEIEDRAALAAEVERVEKQYTGPVPRPPHWGGYEMKPQLIELWFDRDGRLHDRYEFQATENEGWSLRTLSP